MIAVTISNAHQKGTPIDLINSIKEAGFEHVFVEWYNKDWEISQQQQLDYAREAGLNVLFAHLGYQKINNIWLEGEEGEGFVERYKNDLKLCHENDIDLVCMHLTSKSEAPEPNEAGLRRFQEIADYAKELGIKIAFENTEGEEYLFALMDAFKDNESVGFCWDSGHEMCYNHSKDLLAMFGDRLIATHINDNLGIKDYNGEITYLDDLHLLPFDGIADWDYNTKRLLLANCPEILTFELTRNSKRDRHDNDIYKKMDITDYISECYKRACRVAAKLTIR